MIRLEKNGAFAEIAPLGAEMRRYVTRDGKERLWSGAEPAWKNVAPVLFPMIGAVKDGKVRIGGKEYIPPRHGFAKLMEFEPTDHGDDFCALEIHQTPETLEGYPFAFTLTVIHRLLCNGFVTEYVVENKSQEPMPFTIGGHPGFACPTNEGEAFSDYVVRFDKPEEGQVLQCLPDGLMRDKETVDLGVDRRTLALDYTVFDQKDTLIFAGLNSRGVELVHKETGKGLRFSFPQSSTLAVWTRPEEQAPFVCLEPWIGLPAFANETGNFEEKPYHVDLAPGQSFRTWYQVDIIE